MAIYQVHSYSKMGITTDYEEAKQFLTEIKDKDCFEGIFLLYLDEETGEFRCEDHVELETLQFPLGEITKEEKDRLPNELFIMNMNRTDHIEYDIFLDQISMIKFLRARYQEFSDEIDYLNDNFTRWSLFDGISQNLEEIPFEDVVKDIRKTGIYSCTVKVGKITNLNPQDIGNMYFNSTDQETLRKAFNLAKKNYLS